MDKDLASIQEVRDLLRKARAAADQFKDFTQDQVDRIVSAMAQAAQNHAKRLARMAHEETGFGIIDDKVIKNTFASKMVQEHLKSIRTCGVIRHNEQTRVMEIAVPMGVVAALIPCTNPTSTAIHNSLIAIKARNAIVLSPHPRALGCIMESARILNEAAASVGGPRNLVQAMSLPTMEGTHELMHNELTSVILATGGSAMVRAAYSAGKPAYGVGPGNVPAYVDRTADVAKAAADIIAGKSFDHGVICASEQAALADRPVSGKLMEEMRRNGAYFATSEEKRALERVMVGADGHVKPSIVGQSPQKIAELAGFRVPNGTRALVVMLEKVGLEEPLSCEKLSPVLGFYVVEGWKEGCKKAIALLEYGGLGHSFSIHCQNPDIVLEFGLQKPASRILVNTSSTHGAIGYSTGLAPSMTLGPGTIGGSSTSDNVDTLHLVNIRRIAYETLPLRPTTSSDKAKYRYNDSYHYRPEGEVADAAEKPVAGRSYGKSGINDNDIERIVREFSR